MSGTRPATALVMSTTTISVLDIEDTSRPEVVLLELKGQNRKFVSLDKTAASRGANYTCLCTTFELMWIDECRIGPPILSWRHNYGDGKIRDLEVTNVEYKGGGKLG